MMSLMEIRKKYGITMLEAQSLSKVRRLPTLTETMRLSFNLDMQMLGDEVVMYMIEFYDGVQSRLIYSETDGQLIAEVIVPYGRKVGFPTIILRDTIFPDVYPMLAYCEVFKNGVLYVRAEKEENSSGYIEFGPTEIPDWNLLIDEAIEIAVGFV